MKKQRNNKNVNIFIQNQFKYNHSCCYEWLVVVIVEINVLMLGITLMYLSALFSLFLIETTLPSIESILASISELLMYFNIQNSAYNSDFLMKLAISVIDTLSWILQ